ncbi:hypothetical protein DF141_06455 [Burkholderia cenocepacia]|nr:hypothetical protein DF141_06455 [Burkholderia cenocepacia]
MSEREQVPVRGTSDMTAAADAAGTVNSVERALPHERVSPVAAANPDDPSAVRLDWIDPDALATLKRRRQHDLAAAREGMQAPEWVVSSQAPARDGGEKLSAGRAAVPADAADAEEHRTRGAENARQTASPSMTEPLAMPPESVAKRFLQAGHRYFLRDGSREMAFEDRGVRMVTAHNRQDIAESMAEMALAKGWSHIRVKGHADFRRAVWLEAAVRGIGVTGHVPDERDRAALAELMQARMTNRVDQAGASGIPAGETVPGQASCRDDVPEARWTGQLIRHGIAPYQHEAGAARSYFVMLRDVAGTDRTVWGVDLERAMQASGAQSGQTIALSNLGRQPVTINEPVMDAAGQVTGEQPKVVERNVWKVETVGREPASRSKVPPSSVPPSRPATVVPQTSDDRLRPVVPSGVLSPAAMADVLSGGSPESAFQGELVAHGRAPYQNRAGAQATYFATLREPDGRQVTVWGADLERAIAASGAQAGDRVQLANHGRRRVGAAVPTVDDRGNVAGIERRSVERYVWRATVESRDPWPVVDPQRTLHMSVIAEAMRAQGFSEKSVAKVQARAGEVMDRLRAQGVEVPAPRVFDPAGRVQKPRSRGNPAAPFVAPEVERVLQPTAPAVPSR